MDVSWVVSCFPFPATVSSADIDRFVITSKPRDDLVGWLRKPRLVTDINESRRLIPNEDEPT
jgi:hypothetical protein